MPPRPVNVTSRVPGSEQAEELLELGRAAYQGVAWVGRLVRLTVLSWGNSPSPNW